MYALVIGIYMNMRTKPALDLCSAGLAAMAAAGTLMGALAISAGAKPLLALRQPAPIAISAEAITSFAKAGFSNAATGKLLWRGGLVLSAETEKFGGYSGLVLSSDGQDLLAVSDAGGWISARVRYAGSRPIGLSDAMIGSILMRDGSPIRRNRERDAEGLALASGTLAKGEVLISFENFNRIVRYAVVSKGLGLPIEAFEAPPGLRRFSPDGMEALAVLKGGPYKGRMVAFSENARDDGRHSGWIWTGGTAKPMQVISHGGFALTDAASLADGTLLLLERRFTLLDGVRMRLRRIDPTEVKPGAILDGEILIEADLSNEIDNMEGLAVHTGPGGETVLTLISDDNFNTMMQRTLLLQFTLPERTPS